MTAEDTPMKDQLLALYQRHHASFKAVVDSQPGADMAGPHLMSPNNLYAQQPHRLLIVGQETGGWTYHINDLPEQMASYEEFNVGATYRSTPFWNITRNVEKALGNAPYSCAWTNISKFDHNNGRASEKFEASIANVDDILLEEVGILKPTVCLFYTGPVFESRLCAIFKGIKFHEVAGFPERQLARLEHPTLPEQSYRTYHPKYLRLAKMEASFVQFIENHVR